MIDRLLRASKHLFGVSDESRSNTPTPLVTPNTSNVTPIHPRVLMIVHDPPVPSAGGKRLTELFGWFDPDQLAHQYINDLAECSGGYLNYTIVERIAADWYPIKQDGFRYTNETFIKAWKTRQMYEPNAIDYETQIATFELIRRYERGGFDEVWFFSFPYAGDYESTMVGRGAFWCNSPPVPNTDYCLGRFVIMAFNYERGVDCMLENFGHRTESIMSRVYQQLGQGENMWEHFIRYDKIAPKQSQCGTVHFAPNSERDYDWGNRRSVMSYCDDWYNYPHLSGKGRIVNCQEWGDGDMRAHHKWWLRHLPCVTGETHGVANNWWQYVVDPNLVP